ncbi:MAG TPA: hypothetical protein VGG27_01765 [Magnetospirillaceae bacterium]|jgi:hypothetical protein
MTHMRNHRQGDTQQASISTQFWVVGGEYNDTAFDRLTGPAEALGPFADYDTAYREWEKRSMEMKRHAHVRYTIVGNQAR